MSIPRRAIAAAAVLLLAPTASGQGVSPAHEAAVATWIPLREPSVGGRVTGLSVSPHDPSRILLAGDMLGVGLSTDGGDSWGATFGFASWEASSFSWHPTDPRRVWVGTMGGPYESRDAGRRWQARRLGLPPTAAFDFSAPIEIVLFDPNDAEHLLAAGGTSRRWRVGLVNGALGAVWESRDGGVSWSRLTTITAAGSSSGAAAAGQNIVGMTFAAGSSLRLYATVDRQGFYRSLDGGATWAKVGVGLPHVEVERVVADPRNRDVVTVSLGNNGTVPGGVYRSVDGGLNWLDVSSGLPRTVGASGGTTTRYKALAADATGQRWLAVDDRFGSVGVFQSEDAGFTWGLALSRAGLPLPYPSGIEMEVATIAAADRDLMFAAGSANLVRSVDGGRTWDDAANVNLGGGRWRGRGYSGLVATEVTFNPWRRGHILAQGFDGARVLQTFDSGASWTFETSARRSFNGGADAVFAGPDIAYASLGFQNAFEGVARTVDGGQTWQVVAGAAAGLPEIGDPAKAGAIHASVVDPRRVWVLIDGTVHRSTDGGSTWAPTALSPGNGWFAAKLDESRLYVSGDTAVYESADGVTFRSIGGPGRPGKLAMAPDGTLWLAAHDRTGNPGLGLWSYRPGVGWLAVLDPRELTGAWQQAVEYIVAVAVRPDDPRTIAVSTADPPFRDVSRATGVYLSRDGGATWPSINRGLPMRRGAALAFDPHRPGQLVLGTAGRGFFRYRLAARDR
ncbi:MAG: hypothetical protein AAF628_32920 [Planctomycetota bacterium]